MASLTPSEVAFLCENEPVIVIPRQNLAPLQLIAGSTPTLRPPHRATLPLWLGLLLKRQRRASIVPPSWLNVTGLQAILDREIAQPHHFTQSSTDETGTSSSADALPHRYLEVSALLISHCYDDIPDCEQIQRLLQDLREVRLAKMRNLVTRLDAGAGINLSGLGALELCENRSFLQEIVNGLRILGASREAALQENLDEAIREGLTQDRYDGDDMDV